MSCCDGFAVVQGGAQIQLKLGVVWPRTGKPTHDSVAHMRDYCCLSLDVCRLPQPGTQQEGRENTHHHPVLSCLFTRPPFFSVGGKRICFVGSASLFPCGNGRVHSLVGAIQVASLTILQILQLATRFKFPEQKFRHKIYVRKLHPGEGERPRLRAGGESTRRQEVDGTG